MITHLVIVTGGRYYRDAAEVERRLSAYPLEGVVLVHGDCPGLDRSCASWAEQKRPRWTVLACRPRWHIGKKAGHERNLKMAKFGKFVKSLTGIEVVVERFPGGNGTANMEAASLTNGLQVKR